MLDVTGLMQDSPPDHEACHERISKEWGQPTATAIGVPRWRDHMVELLLDEC